MKNNQIPSISLFLLVYLLFASCSSSKLDYASAYRFSEQTYKKNNTTSVTPEKIYVDNKEEHVKESILAEKIQNLNKKTEELTSAEAAGGKVNNTTSYPNVENEPGKKISKSERKEVKSFLKREIEKYKKEIRNGKKLNKEEASKGASGYTRIGIILALIGLICLILSLITWPFLYIGITLIVVGFIFILLDLV